MRDGGHLGVGKSQNEAERKKERCAARCASSQMQRPSADPKMCSVAVGVAPQGLLGDGAKNLQMAGLQKIIVTESARGSLARLR